MFELLEQTALQMSVTVAQCNFPEYTFNVILDNRGSIYLQGSYMEEDTVTKIPELQKTRRWFLSPEMTKDEIVQTVFKCVLTSLEHRCSVASISSRLSRP